jgi:hypothetical protein
MTDGVKWGAGGDVYWSAFLRLGFLLHPLQAGRLGRCSLRSANGWDRMDLIAPARKRALPPDARLDTLCAKEGVATRGPRIVNVDQLGRWSASSETDH